MDSPREKVVAEEENINQALNDLQFALSRPEQTVVEVAALGTFLLNIYTGIENILKQILQAKKLAIPHTSSSHKDLLVLAVAEKIISQSLADELLPFLSFRHFFVHAYGFMLDDKPVRNLAMRIPTVYTRFVNEIDAALQSFEISTTQP